jgi:uncharacterized protein
MSKGKIGTAVVTGASAGIGATYADRLAKRGYDLVLVARDIGRLEELSRRLEREYGVNIEALQADLVAGEDLLKVERRLRKDDVTLLVNNAGIGPQEALLTSDLDYLDRMIALNVTAVNRLAVAAAQAFAARKRGDIINIASVTALVPERFHGT